MTVTRSLAAAVVVAAVTLPSGCGGAAEEAAPPAPQASTNEVTLTAGDARSAGIETAPARVVERTDALQAPGVVGFDERRTSRMGALVEGVVDALDVEVGDRVVGGAVIGRIHSHVVHDAWAAYFKAEAERRRAETELGYARTAESRAAQLVRDKALSPQELDRARADVAGAEQMLAAARAELTRAGLDLRHYGLTPRLDGRPEDDQDVPITAPFAATVIERLVSRGAAVTPGTPMLVLSDLSRVWVTVEVDEAQLGRVATGRAVAIRAPAYAGVEFPGTLASIGDVVNPATRRVRLRIEAPNPERRLKPEMLVTVTLRGAAPRAVIVVPSLAVHTVEGEAVVFVQSSPGVFTPRPGEVGAALDEEIEITSGLSDGDVVATAGSFLLKSAVRKPAGTEEP